MQVELQVQLWMRVDFPVQSQRVVEVQLQGEAQVQAALAAE
jgi:hypothetical protein